MITKSTAQAEDDNKYFVTEVLSLASRGAPPCYDPAGLLQSFCPHLYNP